MNHTHTYLFLLFLLLLLPGKVMGQQDPIVRRVRFEGNDAFSKKELLQEITFSQGNWITRNILRQEASYYSSDAWEMNVRELIHFYQSEGYLDIQIDEPLLNHKRNHRIVNVTFRIHEGNPVVIESVDFIGADKQINISLKELIDDKKTTLKVLQGERFRDEFVWNDRDNITRFMVEKGHAYAETTPVITTDTTNNTARIRWNLSPGPLSYFGEITIEGNERTPEDVIRKQIAFEPGDIYSRQKLNLSQQQIYQLGTFRVASLKAMLTRDMNETIPVQLSITEAPATSTRIGVGYGREDQFRTFVNFQVLNFTGGARRLNLYAKHSALEPYRLEATLTQPAALSPNSTLSVSPFFKRQKEAGFDLFSYGSNLLLLQKLNNRTSASFNIYYESVNLDTTSVALIENQTFFSRSYSKSGVAAGVLFDDSSPQFDPLSGWIIAFNIRANSMVLSGNYPFLKYQLETKKYQRISDLLTIAGKIKLGNVNPTGSSNTIPVEERFFSGGSRSVRGWGRQQLGPKDANGIPIGGNYIFEATVEPRVKIYGPFSMLAFLDAGNVWQKSDEISLSKIRFAAGGGVRYSTPIGPIGIDIARPVWDESSKWQFHLNIGHAF